MTAPDGSPATAPMQQSAGARESQEVVEPARVQALAALFDDGLGTPGIGDLLPPLWHWAALPSWPAAGLIGPDGHPTIGGFMPDTGLPRRMFAGGRVILHAPVPVGATVRRTDEVVSATPKEGRSGRLVIVVVETRIHVPTPSGGEVLAITEQQDIVYREARDPDASRPALLPQPPIAPRLLTARPDGVFDFATDPVRLMRFSAATSNGHRIHYDWPYTTGVEGYPGLVVHGPLMTLSLAEVARLTRPEAAAYRFEHRSNAPLFCGQPARVVATGDEQGRRLLSLTSDRGTTYTTLTLSPTA